jgi:hypothetical protein
MKLAAAAILATIAAWTLREFARRFSTVAPPPEDEWVLPYDPWLEQVLA